MRRETTAGTEWDSSYFAYGADNALTRRQVFTPPAAFVDTYFYYGQNGALATMWDSPIYGIGSCVEIYVPGTPDKTYTLVMDHCGTGHVLLDETGAETGRRYYDAFGVLLGETGSWPVDLGYQSNWLTIKIGNKWWGLSAARLYDFATGRFVQRDVLPDLLKLLTPGKRNASGIYSNTSFAAQIATTNSIAGRDHTTYAEWFLNRYCAWSSEPVGEIDVAGLGAWQLVEGIAGLVLIFIAVGGIVYLTWPKPVTPPPPPPPPVPGAVLPPNSTPGPGPGDVVDYGGGKPKGSLFWCKIGHCDRPTGILRDKWVSMGITAAVTPQSCRDFKKRLADGDAQALNDWQMGEDVEP